MDAIYILIGIIAYFFIGATLGSVLDLTLDDLILCVSFWPFMLCFIVIFWLFDLAIIIGKKIRDVLTRV